MYKRLIKIKNLLLLLVLCAGLSSAPAMGAETLTLDQAITLALTKNSGVEITKARIEEQEQKLKEMRSHYWPRLVALGTSARMTNPIDYQLGQGSITPPMQNPPIPIPIPPNDISIRGDETSFVNVTAMVVQPVTQLLKINSGVDIASTDVKIAGEELDKVRGDIRYAVEKVYYGILIAGRQKKEAELRIALEEARLSDAKNALESGVALPLEISGLKAALLDKKKELLDIENQEVNLTYMLNDLTGRPLETDTLLDDTLNVPDKAQTLAQYDESALAANHELAIADLTLKKANLAVDAAKKEFLPDMNLFALYNYGHDFNVVNNHIGAVGVSLSWTIFYFGQKNSVLGQRQALHHQAQRNYQRVKNEVQREIKKEVTNLRYSDQLVSLASQAVAFRKNALKLASDLDDTGLRLNTTKLEAEAELAKAEADLFAAQLSRRLVLVNLTKLTGRPYVREGV